MGKHTEAHYDLERETAFGQWLTAKRGEMKQQTLAALVSKESGQDTHPGRISQWETGFRLPSTKQLAALKAILDPTGPPPPAPVKVVRSPGRLKC
jgi:hypothetical protein